MPATAAIFHHPDAIESAQQPLAGRRTAGQSFLAGYVRHVEADTLHTFANRPGHIQQFREIVAAHGWTGGVEGALASDPAKIAAAGTASVPGPNLASFAWVRRRLRQDAYSICGITHTVSTRRIMDGLAEGLSAPVESWDAIICTSRAVHSVVEAEIDAVAAYLSRRFAAARVPRPQLPVIPLGIDTGRFSRNEADRARWRAEFAIPEDGIAVMTMGRRSVAEKMHPGPLMEALQRAATRTCKRVTLLMVGWFAEETTERMHREMAKGLAPDVDVHFPDGKDPDLRFEIWSAADIFALPVDNIQETYGLAPVEAMAAGLPVVCSDWNGFRDTLEQGVTGILVPTYMARPGIGAAIAQRFEDSQDTYHQYLVAVHQRTAVDVSAMADAFTALIESPEKRAEMGRAGVARARTHFDWAAIIPQYQELWGDLAARRKADVASSARAAGAPSNPAAIDPFTLYARYPSDHLTADTMLRAEGVLTVERIEELVELTGARVYRRVVGRADEVARVHEAVRVLGPVRYADLLQRANTGPQALEPILLWLLKFGLIEVAR